MAFLDTNVKAKKLLKTVRLGMKKITKLVGDDEVPGALMWEGGSFMNQLLSVVYLNIQYGPCHVVAHY